MGDVVDPKPPQWNRKEPLEDVPEDRTLLLVMKLMAALTEELDTPVVRLAALRLVQKGVIVEYRQRAGTPAAEETLRQARDLAGLYVIQGPDGTEEA